MRSTPVTTAWPLRSSIALYLAFAALLLCRCIQPHAVKHAAWYDGHPLRPNTTCDIAIAEPVDIRYASRPCELITGERFPLKNIGAAVSDLLQDSAGGGPVCDQLDSAAEHQLILGYFGSRLASVLTYRSPFEVVQVTCGTRDSPFDTLTRVIPWDGPTTFPVPAEGTMVNDTCQAAEFTLIVSELLIRAQWERHGKPGVFYDTLDPISHGLATWRDLAIEARYMLWDNTRRQPASYGNVRVEDPNSFGITLDDWEAAIDLFVDEMLVRSPFRK